MVVTVFHLVALGLLALLSVIGPGWSGSAPALVGRIGVFLLLLAVAHAATLSALVHAAAGRSRADPFPRERPGRHAARRSARTSGTTARTAPDPASS